MTVLLRKEIRSLLPGWALTMAATALIAFVQLDGTRVLLFLVAIGSLVLGITSFGAEFNQGTFSLLLAQPIPRNKIWWTKTLVLGAALLSIAIMVWVAFACVILRNSGDLGMIRAEDLGVPAVFTVVLFGAAFAGGLLSALATRQMATAFWIALLFPLAVCGAALIFTMGRSDGTIYASIAAALAVYDILAFLLARYQFLRAQDLPGASGTVVSLPAWTRFGAKARVAVGVPLRRPLRALIAKEFQLHQITLCFAAVLLLLHVIVLFIRWMIFVPKGPQKDLYDILGSWWLLWLVLPVVVAGTAVAEERRQGTLEGSLCLPTKKTTQWFIKCAICFLIALFFGGIMPWLLETGGQLIGPPSPIFQTPDALFADHWHFLRWTVPVAAVITLIAFYASSLSRSLLQAVGIGVFIVSVLGWITTHQMTNSPRYYSAEAWLVRNELRSFWLCALFALLLWLSYTNFKHVIVGRRLWWRNALILLVVPGFTYGTIMFFLQVTQFLWPRNVF